MSASLILPISFGLVQRPRLVNWSNGCEPVAIQSALELGPGPFQLMSKRKSNRAAHYLLGVTFALFISGYVGGFTFLLVATALPEIEIPVAEADRAAMGLACFMSFVCLLAQLWCYATRRRLRARRATFRLGDSASIPR